MTQNRVRIVDVADALGLSTATVSKVIHGKTEKISDETVKRVQQELERSGYIPNMAGILLARNNSRIIGVVVNDHVKLLLLCGATAGVIRQAVEQDMVAGILADAYRSPPAGYGPRLVQRRI